MRIVVLLAALIVAFVLGAKEYIDDAQKLKAQQELNEVEHYPNLLPEVEVVAYRA